DVIDRNAHRLRKPVITEDGRFDAELAGDVVMADGVQLVGGDPRHHMRADHVQNLRSCTPRGAHAVLFGGGFNGNTHASCPLLYGLWPSWPALHGRGQGGGMLAEIGALMV